MFIGFDCGTQGTKAIVLDEDGQALGRGNAARALIERDSDAREQHPLWGAATVAAARVALNEARLPGGEIRRVGVPGQQHGPVAPDGVGTVIRPAKPWNDAETAPENDRSFGGPAAPTPLSAQAS